MHPAEVIALALEARTLPAAIPERRCLEAPAALAPAAGAAMTGAVLALVAGFLVTRRFIRRAL